MTAKYEINFREYASRVNGIPDKEATLAKFESEYNDFDEIYGKDHEVMLAALDHIFLEEDPTGGGTMEIGPAIVAALVHAGGGKINPNTFSELQERTRQVIKDSDRYYTTKGPGGGCSRMNDEQLAVFKATGKTPHDLVRDANEVKLAVAAAKKAAKKA